MLVVLDAGVFVSAAITPGGVASRIVAAALEGRFDYLVCPRLLDEVTSVLSRPKAARYLNQADRERLIADVRGGGHEVDDPLDIEAQSRDPDDDYLVALARQHNAEHIVTGDADLLTIENPPVLMTRLRAFLDQLDSSTT